MSSKTDPLRVGVGLAGLVVILAISYWRGRLNAATIRRGFELAGASNIHVESAFASLVVSGTRDGATFRYSYNPGGKNTPRSTTAQVAVRAGAPGLTCGKRRQLWRDRTRWNPPQVV